MSVIKQKLNDKRDKDKYDKNKEKIQVQLWFITDDKKVSKGYAKWWLDIKNDEELMKIFS
ncbi:hypothetical protein CUPS4256_03215 [Campylobacter upsaliensis]|uniref:hypothetical protein n=1 Tax=Campylobacter upsaliensis TaxID=28080 RepID=UPI002149E7DA|nr:hypothetical protein [Campylobacter upsaliensis]MCR2102266.1 hypothetical protein [Campylobacter upsaliensis]MCR2103918.1 hypothetical protein [Campylobacter upsaliensis]